jgi:hypothetical protein
MAKKDRVNGNAASSERAAPMMGRRVVAPPQSGNVPAEVGQSSRGGNPGDAAITAGGQQSTPATHQHQGVAPRQTHAIGDDKADQHGHPHTPSSDGDNGKTKSAPGEGASAEVEMKPDDAGGAVTNEDQVVRPFKDGLMHKSMPGGDPRIVIGWAADDIRDHLQVRGPMPGADRKDWLYAKPELESKVCDHCADEARKLGLSLGGDKCKCEKLLSYSLSKDILTVRARDLSHHTAMIASSGSGKSYLLGSLIEEVVLRTQIHLTILDPNADFRKFHLASTDGLLSTPNAGKRGSYMHNEQMAREVRVEGDLHRKMQEMLSRLANETLGANREKVDEAIRSFDGPIQRNERWWSQSWKDGKEWPRVWGECVKSLRRIGNRQGGASEDASMQTVVPPRFPWKVFAPELLAESSADGAGDPQRLAHMRLIHEYVIQALEADEAFTVTSKEDESDAVERVCKYLQFRLLGSPKGPSAPNVSSTPSQPLEQAFQSIQAAFGLKSVSASDAIPEMSRLEPIRRYLDAHRFLNKTLKLVKPMPGGNSTGARIVTETAAPKEKQSPDQRTLEVYDLLAENSTGLIYHVAYLALQRVWLDAAQRFADAALDPSDDKFTPHMIVIDEAHNLVPSEDVSNSGKVVRQLLKDLIVKIAAEGRKFNLVLLLVTQRPDKIDARVLSECANQIILRVNSDIVLNNCQAAFNIQFSARMRELIMGFDKGQGLLTGVWAEQALPDDEDGPKYFQGAARRTEEGAPSDTKLPWTKPKN